ncbi:protein kinase domain-containing protein [Pseudomonas sp. SAR267]|uniref:protein kinase domain-containing protein n=1 Tax=Pseudomonas sp. SAR267 TaxID=3454502 RepID=UPI003F9141CD
MDSAEAKLFSDTLLAGPNISGWKLTGYISHGKSAVVLNAQHGQKTAVIKVFHPTLVEQYGREAQQIRVDRERSLIGKHHDNIIKIIDAGLCKETGNFFVAMEIADGKPLCDVLGLIPSDKISLLIEQLASAAMQLELWGVTHRDIKPSNIHVSEDFSSLKLLDFGVMKPHGDDSATLLQVSKAFIGTHQYSPPEMIHGREDKSIEGWRAITFYQIGAVLHDLIVRKPLFHHATVRHADLVLAINNEPVVVTSNEVDENLCGLATRCLVKNPIERLDLVTWEQFKISANESTKLSLDARKEALQRRLKLNSVLSLSDALEKQENRRLDEIRLKEIVGAARETFDIALAALQGIMPSRETTVDGHVYPNPALTYSFNPAPKLGLDTKFRFQIAIENFTDRQTVDVHVRASKGLGDTEIGWTKLGPAFKNFENFSEKFQEWLVKILEELIAEQTMEV